MSHELVIQHLENSSLAGEKQTFSVNLVRLGRHPDNDVAFSASEDTMASGHHAEIAVKGSELYVRDVGSSNGTFVNGRRIESTTMLGHGDRVSLGRDGPKLVAYLVGVRDEGAIPATMPPKAISKTVPGTNLGKNQGIGHGTLLKVIRSATEKERKRTLFLAGAIVLAVLVLAIVFIPGSNGDEPSPPPDAGATDSLAEVARRYEESVFLIVAVAGRNYWTGTGFVVDASGILGTNAHVVDDMRAGHTLFAVQNGTHKRFEIENWAPHPRYKNAASDDVALVKLTLADAELEPLPLASPEEWEALGRGVLLGTIGFPGEFQYLNLRSSDFEKVEATFKDGRIGRITDYAGRAAPPSKSRRIQHDALVTPGTSGSPMFTADGKVVAVHNAGRRQILEVGGKRKLLPDSTGTRWAIRIDALGELLTDPKWKK